MRTHYATARLAGADRRSDRDGEPAASPVARWRLRRRIDGAGRVLAAIAGFAVIFVCGLYLTGMVGFSLALRSPWPIGVRAEDHFVRTKMGEILFEATSGNICRKILFHNDTGYFGADQTIRCNTGLRDDETASVRPGSDRLMSLRDAFTRK